MVAGSKLNAADSLSRSHPAQACRAANRWTRPRVLYAAEPVVVAAGETRDPRPVPAEDSGVRIVGDGDDWRVCRTGIGAPLDLHVPRRPRRGARWASARRGAGHREIDALAR